MSAITFETYGRVLEVYRGSDGRATQALYDELNKLGMSGVIAVNLFRACKCSERAKVYRKGPGYKTAAYERKNWSIENLAKVLAPTTFPFGWAIDEEMRCKGDPNHHIIYVDLPTGQVSFHNGIRHAGPDYKGTWDRAIGTAPDRICRYVAGLLDGPPRAINPTRPVSEIVGDLVGAVPE